MAAITKEQLADKIELAFDRQADVVVDVDQARRKIAEDIAQAVNDFVIGRTATGAVVNHTTANVIIQ